MKRILRRLIHARKLVLSLAGIATVAGLIVLGVVDAPETRAQAVAPPKPVNQMPPIYPPLAKMARQRTFEVASVKAWPEDRVGGVTIQYSPDRLTLRGVDLWISITVADGVRDLLS